MDKDVFVENVKILCVKRGIKPTVACRESGVGGSFISDINRGQTPSVAKVQMLADYLGVTTSELLGEKEKPAPQTEDGLNEKDGRLLIWFRSLPAEKQKAILIAQDAPEDLLADLDH